MATGAKGEQYNDGCYEGEREHYDAGYGGCEGYYDAGYEDYESYEEGSGHYRLQYRQHMGDWEDGFCPEDDYDDGCAGDDYEEDGYRDENGFLYDANGKPVNEGWGEGPYGWGPRWAPGEDVEFDSEGYDSDPAPGTPGWAQDDIVDMKKEDLQEDIGLMRCRAIPPLVARICAVLKRERRFEVGVPSIRAVVGDC